MIYFVDEDVSAFGAWIWELERNRMAVKPIQDADTAFEILRGISLADATLVVIDVMLAVSNPTRSRYGSERTYEYLETGLRLLEDLCEVNAAVFPTRAALLTNTANPSTLEAATALSQELKVPLWQKASIYSPVAFLDKVEQQLKDLATKT